MNRKDVIALFSKDSAAQIPEKVALQCFGMSKMTIINETKDSKKYDRIELAEMCEMICRCADNKFKTAGLTNAQMIELMLDELFLVTNFDRRDVNVNVEELSESDDEY